MIIRSGLIRNRDGVEVNEFTQHWRGGHAPLVVEIDGLRAYSQNHITQRLISDESQGLHRIDGISQLYFDDIHAMNVAMASPEQEACIVDLRGFLNDVTLLIQDIGKMYTSSEAQKLPVKSMYLLQGDTQDIATAAKEAARSLTDQGSSVNYRINTILARDIQVDQSISAGQQIIDAVLEIWVSSDADALQVSEALRVYQGVNVIAGFVTEEFVVLEHDK